MVRAAVWFWRRFTLTRGRATMHARAAVLLAITRSYCCGFIHKLHPNVCGRPFTGGPVVEASSGALVCANASASLLLARRAYMRYCEVGAF
jgi:hypothetical protein